MTTANADESDVLDAVWTIDPTASHVTFAVRYALLGSLRGRFTEFEGLLVLHPDITRCNAILVIHAASVRTGPPAQDQWLRSAAFLDTDNYPDIWFESTQLAPHPDHRRRHDALLTGELTIRDVTRPLTCTVQLRQLDTDSDNVARAHLTGRAQLSRADFSLGTGHDTRRRGILLGDQLSVDLDIRAVRQPGPPARTADSAPPTTTNPNGDRS